MTTSMEAHLIKESTIVPISTQLGIMTMLWGIAMVRELALKNDLWTDVLSDVITLAW